jgi:hypothetical protein
MKEPLKREHDIRIDGKEVDDKTYKRLVNAPAPRPTKDTATAPPHSAVRGFQLLR